jgi:hypothetical protein
MCPYYLDGDLLGRALRLCPVIPTYIGYCAVFKVREEMSSPPSIRDRSPLSAGGCAGLSKLNSMQPPTGAREHLLMACQVRSTCLVTERAQSFDHGALELRWPPPAPSAPA